MKLLKEKVTKVDAKFKEAKGSGKEYCELFVTQPVTKWSFEERAEIDTVDKFKLMVFGLNVEDVKAWENGTEKEVDIVIHGDTYENQNTGKKGMSVDMSLDRICKNAISLPKAKTEPNTDLEDDDDLPF